MFKGSELKLQLVKYGKRGIAFQWELGQTIAHTWRGFHVIAPRMVRKKVIAHTLQQ